MGGTVSAHLVVDGTDSQCTSAGGTVHFSTSTGTVSTRATPKPLRDEIMSSVQASKEHDFPTQMLMSFIKTYWTS